MEARYQPLRPSLCVISNARLSTWGPSGNAPEYIHVLHSYLLLVMSWVFGGHPGEVRWALKASGERFYGFTDFRGKPAGREGVDAQPRIKLLPVLYIPLLPHNSKSLFTLRAKRADCARCTHTRDKEFVSWRWLRSCLRGVSGGHRKPCSMLSVDATGLPLRLCAL